MKKLLKALTTVFALSCTALSAEINEDGYGLENPFPEQPDKQKPFHGDVATNFIGNSKITNDAFKGQTINYNQSEAELGAIFYYNPATLQGMQLALAYTNTNMNWSENPYFDQTAFHNINVCLGWFCNKDKDWLLKAQACVNLNAQRISWDYTTYDLLLWGRYTYSPCLGIHVGFYAQTGMKIDRMYPVLGVDWTINPKWKLNLVFPLDLDLSYTFADHWSLNIAGRFFEARERTGKENPLPEAVFAYRNAGIELGLNYIRETTLKINVHVGSTVPARLTIANKHYEDKQHIKFNGAPYAGGAVEVLF